MGAAVLALFARRLDQLSPATLRSAVRGCGSPSACMLTADDGGAPSR